MEVMNNTVGRLFCGIYCEKNNQSSDILEMLKASYIESE
jgi:hypothetical protein